MSLTFVLPCSSKKLLRVKDSHCLLLTSMLPDGKYKYLNYNFKNLNMYWDTNNKTEYFIFIVTIL